MLIQNPNFFFTFLEQLAAQLQQTVGSGYDRQITVLIKGATALLFLQAAELFGMIVDIWSERMDSIANIQRRKLTGLAMANLLPLADL